MTPVEPARPRAHWLPARSAQVVRPGARWATVLAPLAAATTITALVWHTGRDGSPTGLVHLFYLPITYVGVRFGRLAAAGAGVLAGLASGPFMPAGSGNLPSLADSGQPLSEWIIRLGSMVVVAVVVAWLARQQPRPVEDLVHDVVLARSLRSAVDSGRITAHYQPIVDLAAGRVVGVEALARWTNRSGREVSPGTFIPVAERSGVILALGGRILELAVRQAEEWGARRSVAVAVNVSAAQLGDPRFVPGLTRVLASSALAPRDLCLEITETAIIADPDAALATVRAASALGVRIALDDFGTGQSSLAYLAEFPIDVVKIDKSFVDDVDSDPKVNALVLAIIEMSRALGAVTIAEGIERPAQLAALRSLGCQLGQGYLLGRPVPAAKVDLDARVIEVPRPARSRTIAPPATDRAALS